MKSISPKPTGRPAAVDIYPGKVFGRLTILGKVHTKEGLMFRWQCKCGEKGKCPRQHLVRPEYPKTHCGCQAYIDANPFPREKGIWHMMHKRTEDPTHVSYHYYGGRGIKVCPEWNKTNPQGWNNFIKFVGGAPTKKHTIDRVNPNLGYQPYQEDGVTRQVRWATAKQQANNQRWNWKGNK